MVGNINSNDIDITDTARIKHPIFNDYTVLLSETLHPQFFSRMFTITATNIKRVGIYFTVSFSTDSSILSSERLVALQTKQELYHLACNIEEYTRRPIPELINNLSKML